MNPTPVWIVVRQAQEPAALAARIEWLRHRHHCWDPVGGPLVGDHEATIDQVTGLWREAKALDGDADVLEIEAASLRKRADEKRDEAENLWRPIASQHPELLDSFIEEVDPRVTPV